MMKYVVTGAAGFIGSSMTDRLLELGHDVIGIDNFATGKRKFLSNAELSSRFTMLESDLLNDFYCFDAFQGVDAVYHFAANADIRGGLDDLKRDLQQNTLVTFNVLEAVRKHRIKKLVFSSTAAALGEPNIFPTPEVCPIPAQTSLYGASKMACEGLISAYSQAFGIQSYVFRFVSLLGPRYAHGHVFDFVKNLLVNPNRLEILGDGTQRKSYLHINDCIDALFHICEKIVPINLYEVYHLGANEYCEVRQSARWISEQMSINPDYFFGSGNRGWVGDNPFVFLDTTKARDTGWCSKHSIESSIRETTNWLLSNQWIFED
jgi:UDP-glucose 4-epimerase